MGKKKKGREIAPGLAWLIIAGVVVLVVVLVIQGSKARAPRGPAGLKTILNQIGLRIETPPGGFNATGVSPFGGGPLPPSVEGVKVVQVDAGSPASEAGLQGGDLIKECNGVALRRPELLIRMIVQSGGRPLQLGVLRGGNPVQLTLTAKLQRPPRQG